MGKQISTEDNFNFLLLALILLLFSIAAVEQLASGVGQRFIVAATVITLLISVWSIRQQKVWFRTGLGITFLLFVVVLVGIFFDIAELNILHLMLMLGFYVFTTIIAAKQVLFTGEITSNKIVGAICIFFLVGLIWTILYLLLLEFSPGSLNNISNDHWYNNVSHIVYFSFVTLTTLGYGDVTPALPIAKFFAYTEAIMGLFYIAVMVSSLVGVRTASLSSNSKNNESEQ